MRIALIIAVALLGLENEALAQAAPKEVVVVDGQIAVENGVSNPVPVVDVTPRPLNKFWGYDGRLFNTSSTASVSIPFPAGRFLQLSAIGVLVTSNPASFAECILDISDGPKEFIYNLELTTHVFTVPNKLRARASEQFADLPATKFASVSCSFLGEDGEAAFVSGHLQVSYVGTFRDTPDP